jgi:hypothetical protein
VRTALDVLWQGLAPRRDLVPQPHQESPHES